MVKYKPAQEKPGPKSSLLIALWTTSLARTRLNRILQAHSDRVLYADTDSVYVLASKDQPGPSAPGDLGELKNELEEAFPGQGAYISTFISTGPKSYHVTVKNSKHEIISQDLKMKGFKLTSQVDLDHGKLLQMCTEDEKFTYSQPVFRKDIKRGTVSTLEINKTMAFSSNKRIILRGNPHLDTVPYGFSN